MLEDLPSYDYYIPSECYVSAYQEPIQKGLVENLHRAVDVLLPNGLIICVQIDQFQNLAELRQILRQRYGVTWPFQFLSITHTYTNDNGDILADEEQPFDTLGLVYPFVRVSARGEVPAPICQWLPSTDRTDIESLIDFLERLVEWRDATIPQDLLHAPPSICQTILTNIDSFFVYVESVKKSFTCQKTTTPTQLIEIILNDQNQSSFQYYNASTQPMLKFSYRNEFLFSFESNYPLLQYTYVQECLQKNSQIQLQLIYIKIPKQTKKSAHGQPLSDPSIFATTSRPVLLTGNKENDNNRNLLCQQESTMFKFTVRLPPSPSAKPLVFQLHSGIYYGRRCLFTFEVMPWNNTVTEEITLSTGLPLAHLLPGTLLCFALTNKQSKNYFLNISLFRSNGYLLNGTHEWIFNPVQSNLHKANNKLVYPDCFIGSSTQESNEDHYQIRIKFDNVPYRFHSNDEIAEQLKSIITPTPTVVSTAKHQQQQDSNDDVANGEALNYLLGILNEETQYLVKEPSWLSDWSSAPIDALPCVLHWNLADIYNCVINTRNESSSIYKKIFSMYKLIDCWPTMSFEMCFFLLDCTLPDAHIRSYAVSKLEKLSSHSFLFYLPQISQAAIQFEHFIDTPLIRLILKRALCHRAIGQRLFWILNNTSSRNGRVLLELYKNYCGLTIGNDLKAQITLTLKLNTINQRIRSSQAKDAQSMRQNLIARLQESDKQSWRCISPLDTGCLLGQLLIDECQVYDSFMRPFKLVWENALNPKFERFELIYKIGDDLRQDVLTLQIFHLFDSIWKQAAQTQTDDEDNHLQNLCMTFYDVMCTSDTTGFIRIVPNAYTILNIYHQFNTKTTIKRNVVYDWLLAQSNPSSQKVVSAKGPRRAASTESTEITVPTQVLTKFRKSCAAYCTAGFIIGLGDRHPSNIMLTPDGRLFHVDFGHILGDYVKFGNIFPRETTSIVLVEPFLYVINNRKSDDTSEYRDFLQLCLQTFRHLREHATSIFGLLYLTIYARLPLLNSIEHLNYLRQTLFLIGEKPYETRRALQAYKKKIESAQNDTRRFFDWIAHAFVHKPQR